MRVGLADAPVGSEPEVCFVFTMQPNVNCTVEYRKAFIYSQKHNHWYGILYIMPWFIVTTTYGS